MDIAAAPGVARVDDDGAPCSSASEPCCPDPDPDALVPSSREESTLSVQRLSRMVRRISDTVSGVAGEGGTSPEGMAEVLMNGSSTFGVTDWSTSMLGKCVYVYTAKDDYVREKVCGGGMYVLTIYMCGVQVGS